MQYVTQDRNQGIAMECFPQFPASPIKLGIDEAGRGPVLGAMVYTCFFCTPEQEADLKAMKVDDSKKLTDKDRDVIFDKLQSDEGRAKYGWIIDAISPEELSGKMLRKNKTNLNEISHACAINLIQTVINRGVNLKEVFVDTVGKADIYQRKLQAIFPSLTIRVEEKADSKFPTVSAASILAKVTRDRQLAKWEFVESSLNGKVTTQFGSGYPGDANTKAWLEKGFHPVFGFPSVVRFSWATARDYMEKNGHSVDWHEPEDENEEPKGSGFSAQGKQSMNAFLQTGRDKSVPSLLASRSVALVQGW